MQERTQTGNTVEIEKSKANLAENETLEPMTLEEVRAKLKGTKGRNATGDRWTNSGTQEFQKAVEQEFPAAAQEWVDPVSRRGFMKLMGASMALAGLAGCTKQPDEPIYPYIKRLRTWCLASRSTSPRRIPFPTGAVPLLVKSDAVPADQDRRQSRAQL